MDEVEQAWKEYQEALDRCLNAVKLTAFHTQQCAEATEKAATQAFIVVFAVKEALKGIS